MKTKTYDVYADPGHAWLKVGLTEIERLGIVERISNFSYMNGDNAYLEEDCDAGLFIDALKAYGVEPRYRYHHTDNRSRIRGYQSFVMSRYV